MEVPVQFRPRRYSAPSGETGLLLPFHNFGLKLWHWLLAREASSPQQRPCRIAFLPVEILQVIFLHYQDGWQAELMGKRDINMHNCRKLAAVPVVLGSVCVHWRQITLAMPALWSQLWITMPYGNDIRFFKLWLGRSGSYRPLDLRFDEVPLLDSSVPPDPNLVELLVTAVVHSHRWRHVQLPVQGPFLKTARILALPSLESLSLRASQPWTTSQLFRSLCNAPKLTTLRFYGQQLTGLLVSDVPWEQIITVEFDAHIDWDALASILARSRSLRHLSINTVDFDGIFHVKEGSLAIPTLQRLNVGPHLLNPAEFFGALILPNLLEIGFNRTFGYQFHDGHAALANLVTRSQCRLRSFVWFEPSGNVGLPPEDFILHSLLAPGPSFLDHLEELKISSPVRDLHLKALSRPRKLLPHLETIELEQCWSTDGVLSDMVVSRAMTIKSLSAVLYGSGIILNPRFTRDLGLKLDSVHVDIRKG